MQAALDPCFAAIAASTLYLASSIGMLGGTAGVSAVLQQSLRFNLDARLTDLGFSDEKGGRHVCTLHESTCMAD